MWGKKRELEGRREMEEKGILFVILPLFLMVHGWIHSPLKNLRTYFHSVFLNDHMGGNKCELLLYLEKIVGDYECPKARIHPRWDSAPEKKSLNGSIASTDFLRNLQELCP